MQQHPSAPKRPHRIVQHQNVPALIRNRSRGNVVESINICSCLQPRIFRGNIRGYSVAIISRNIRLIENKCHFYISIFYHYYIENMLFIRILYPNYYYHTSLFNKIYGKHSSLIYVGTQLFD